MGSYSTTSKAQRLSDLSRGQLSIAQYGSQEFFKTLLGYQSGPKFVKYEGITKLATRSVVSSKKNIEKYH